MAITKEDAARFMSAVPEDKKFFCNDGTTLSNIQELEIAIKNMSDDTFLHHVNQEKNDFSNWIYDVIGHTELAESIRKSKDKKSISKQLQKNLKSLSKVAK